MRCVGFRKVEEDLTEPLDHFPEAPSSAASPFKDSNASMMVDIGGVGAVSLNAVRKVVARASRRSTPVVASPSAARALRLQSTSSLNTATGWTQISRQRTSSSRSVIPVVLSKHLRVRPTLGSRASGLRTWSVMSQLSPRSMRLVGALTAFLTDMDHAPTSLCPNG
ncbi:hypothetical protein CC85DRAFT_287849 [Cutaneotrichosporon oleaginosum]|uniref:Uncharacterized protein n=1 Tax=Cutaneotrichosporon oleaginosum TaxID=879819 RepID=A0A0J0XG57_9TREE|nr:uncharacterized protein CC85DRAFT_287849 [Cutaneotrichosporon oleaginosum]KLT40060.1 hypothetical protein CC85DRAFT_287849 [Cutaneotrichosporon oleaginosum]TXT10395.1 hypothetical protein COLE_04329 [Cutaneotrichosporon oleaginosum]